VYKTHAEKKKNCMFIGISFTIYLLFLSSVIKKNLPILDLIIQNKRLKTVCFMTYGIYDAFSHEMK